MAYSTCTQHLGVWEFFGGRERPASPSATYSGGTDAACCRATTAVPEVEADF